MQSSVADSRISATPFQYFNISVAACRCAGAIGGSRSGRNRRQRNIASMPAAGETANPQLETAAEAIARIDALCPWLRGVELRTVAA